MKAKVWGQLWGKMAAAMLMVAALSTTVSAQCAMCRAALEGGNNAAIARSLNFGIIVLLIPPVAIFCAVFITAYKRVKGSER